MRVRTAGYNNRSNISKRLKLVLDYTRSCKVKLVLIFHGVLVFIYLFQLSWATPLDIPRFLPLSDAAGYLGEVANPFMGVM
jgi:hypothetical protein